MDFHNMKRKQLQALCKKHNIPANLTNRELADRLASLLEENGKPVNQGESCLENPVEFVIGTDSTVVTRNAKKVRFSPENERFIFVADRDQENSQRAARHRRRTIMKETAEKPIQVIENAGNEELCVKNMDNPGGIRRTWAQKSVDGDLGIVSLPPVGKKRLRECAKTGSEVVKNVDVSDKPPPVFIRRQLRSREVVVVDNRGEDQDGDIGISRKISMQRGSKKTGNAKSNEGVISSNGVSDSEIPAEGAEPIKVPRRSKRNARKDEGAEILSGEFVKGGIVGRITRSQFKFMGKGSAVESEAGTDTGQEQSEKVPQLEEPSNGLLRKTSRQRSVTFQMEQGKMNSEGHLVDNETKKQSRNTDLGRGTSEVEATVGLLKESEMLSLCSGPLRRSQHNSLMFKATATHDGKLAMDKTVGKNEPLKQLRGLKKTRNAKASDGFLPSDDISEDTIIAGEDVEPEIAPNQSQQNATKDKKFAALSRELGNVEVVGRITRSRAQFEGKFSEVESATETVGVQEECEKVCEPEEPSKGLGRYASRQKSIAPHNPKVEIDGLLLNNKSRKRLKNTDLDKGTYETETGLEPLKNLKENEKVSLPNVRKSRCDVMMLKSTAPPDGEMESHDTVGKKKLKELKEPIIEKGADLSEVLVEETSVTESEPLIENLLHYASKTDSVAARATSKAVGKRRERRARVPVSGEEAVLNKSTSVLEETPIIEKYDCWSCNRRDDSDNDDNKVSDVVSSEITSPADGFSPVYQLDNAGKPNNIMVSGKELGTKEEQTKGKHIQPRIDNVDLHSADNEKIEEAMRMTECIADESVHEEDYLAQFEEDNGTTEPDVHELEFEGHLSESNESKGLKRNFGIASREDKEIAELEEANGITEPVINEINFEDHPSERPNKSSWFERNSEDVSREAKEIHVFDPSDGEGIDQAEKEEIISESHTVTAETGAERVKEIEFTPAVNCIIGTTSFKPSHALEIQEGNRPTVQKIIQSTILGNGNRGLVEVEEFSHYETEIPDGKMPTGETVVSIAWDERCSEETEVVIAKENEQEVTTLALGEENISDGPKGNTRVDGCLFYVSDELDGQVSNEDENKMTEGKLDKNSEKTREMCMDEICDGEGISLVIPEETASGNINEGMASCEFALLQDDDEQEQGKADNLLYSGKELETEEKSARCKCTNPKSDYVACHAAEGDKGSVHEELKLTELEEANGTAEPVILKSVFKDHLSGSDESRGSEGDSEYAAEEAGGLSAHDASDEGTVHAENIVEATEILEIISESHLLTAGTTAQKVTEIQPTRNGHCATENQVSSIGGKVIQHCEHAISIGNDTQEEEEKVPDLAQSTMLERSNANHVERKECSSCENAVPDETICRVEASMSIAGRMCSEQRIEMETTRDNENKEASDICNRSPSTDVRKEIIYEGFEGNISRDGSLVPVLHWLDGQVAKEKANTISEGNIGDCSEEAEAKVNFASNSGRAFPWEEPIAQSSLELVSKFFYDHEKRVAERNCSVDSVKNVPSGENNVVTKDMVDGEGTKGKSDIEQCDPVTEEVFREIERRYLGGFKEVAAQDSGIADSNFAESTHKEREVSEEKNVEMMKSASECTKKNDLWADENGGTLLLDGSVVLNQVGLEYVNEFAKMNVSAAGVSCKTVLDKSSVDISGVAIEKQNFPVREGNLDCKDAEDLLEVKNGTVLQLDEFRPKDFGHQVDEVGQELDCSNFIASAELISGCDIEDGKVNIEITKHKFGIEDRTFDAIPGDSKEFADLGNLCDVSPLRAETGADCMAISTINASASHEYALGFGPDSDMWNAWGINMYFGDGKHDEVKISDEPIIQDGEGSMEQDGINDIKFSVGRFGSKDMRETMEWNKEESKLNATTVDQSPAFANFAVGREKVAEDVQTLQLKLESSQKKCLDATMKECDIFSAKKLNSSMMKVKSNKASLIQVMPQDGVVKTVDMKENAPSIKKEPVGDINAEKASIKRRALEHLQRK